MALPFRRRILLALIALGTLPATVAVIGWALAVRPSANSASVTREAIETVAGTGRVLVQTVDSTRLSTAERRALAAHVRTLGLIELLFSYAISRKLFREHLERRELAGIALLVLGLVVMVLGR